MGMLYDWLPLKSRWLPWFRWLNLPEPIYRHLHFIGPIEVPVDGRTLRLWHPGAVIENGFFWGGIEGGLEPVSMAIWRRLINDAQVIFDVGANSGTYALVARLLNPSAKVVAIEPMQEALKLLRRNVAMNGGGVEVVPCAASNLDGEGFVFSVPGVLEYSVTVGKNLRADDEPVEKIQIPLVRLDTILRDLSLTKVELLKIDVETHEPEVLEGLGAHLGASLPTMLIEILTEDVASRIERLLRGLPYLYFDIDDDARTLTSRSKLRPSSKWNWLICPARTRDVLASHFRDNARFRWHAAPGTQDSR